MRFRSHDHLRIFLSVAREGSLTAAAEVLNLTKGAVGYQIKCLEQNLGFPVFRRLPRGVELTDKGRVLWRTASVAYRDIENTVSVLRETPVTAVTLGLSTYLASRWLSPRLTGFIAEHPDYRIRLQPTIDLRDLEREGIDMAIRWGDGNWSDLVVERLFACPAFATGTPEMAHGIERDGLAKTWDGFQLLEDREGSQAWADWHRLSGLPLSSREERLVIPDPNVRVQAVMDGQGVALNDALVARELEEGKLARLTETTLDHYGYFLVYPPDTLQADGVRALRDWLVEIARDAEINLPD